MLKICAVLFLLAVFLQAEEPGRLAKLMERVHASNAVAGIPLTVQEPQLDGRIAPGEWDQAVLLSGFSSTGPRGQLLGSKQADVFLQRTREHLFIAVKTTTLNDSPGGGLLNTAVKHDDLKITNDDNVELTFHHSSRPDQLIHLIFNPGGACLDILRTLSSKHQDIRWNISGSRGASKVESFWWVLEIKLPLKVLAPEAGILKFNVARNWCDTGTFSTLNKVRKYFRPEEMMTLDLNGAPLTVRQTSLGNPDDGRWSPEVTLENSGKREVIFALMLHEYTFKKVDKKVRRSHKIHGLKKVHVKAGGRAKLALKAEDNSGKLLWLATAVLDARTGKALYQRLVQGRKSLALGRQPATAAGRLVNGSFAAYDYPGYGKTVFFFNFSGKIPKTVVMTAPDGRQTRSSIRQENGKYLAVVPMPSVPGTYALTLDDGQSLCRIIRKNFKWLGNNLGKEKVVLPPFTPVKTGGNNTIEVLYRKHRINAAGLWDSVESKGTELLASPMYFELVRQGKKQPWQMKKIRVAKSTGHDVSYAGEMFSDQNIVLTASGFAEYDGFFWNKFRLENPQKVPIDRLTLHIPLKNKHMPLFHVISNTIRTNPAGYLPAGEGELWNGTKLVRQLHFGKAVMHPQFVPYVWLGGIEKGICFFMDSTYGCRLSASAPQVRIVRKGGVLTLEVDMINIRSTSQVHEFEFGLQATPVKKMHPNLQPMTRDGRGWVSSGLPNLADFNQVRSGFASQWASLPLGNDYSLYKKVISILRKDGRYTGDISRDIAAFFKKHQVELHKGIDTEYPGRSKAIIKSALDAGSISDKRRPAGRTVMYTDPRLVFRYEDGVQYFKSEWWNPARINYIGAWRVTLHPSLQDYLVYHHRKLLECGLQGINLDDAYLMPDDNPQTVARIDEHGILHADAGILQLRNYIKRLATMMHTEFKLYPRYLEAHMSNALIVPAFSLIDGQLGLEQHYGEEPRTFCFPEDEILATGTGRQIGAKSLGLPGLERRTMSLEQWKKVFPRLTRSCIALSVPFGITMRTSVRRRYEHFDIETYRKFYADLAAFGIAEKDCIFIPCFENKLITSDAANIRTGCYKRPGKWLLCVSNFGRKTVETKLESRAFGSKVRFIDWETRREINGRITVPAADFRLILVTGI